MVWPSFKAALQARIHLASGTGWPFFCEWQRLIGLSSPGFVAPACNAPWLSLRLIPSSSRAYHQQLVVQLDEEIDGATWLRAAQTFSATTRRPYGSLQMRRANYLPHASNFRHHLERNRSREATGSPAEKLHDFLERDRDRPFPTLGDAPAWRSVLLSLGEDERAWVWSHHHALCDNFVLPIVRNLFQIYDRATRGRGGFEARRFRLTSTITCAGAKSRIGAGRAAWSERFRRGRPHDRASGSARKSFA